MFVYSKSYMKRFQKSCAIMTSYSLLLILVHIFHFDIFRQIEFWCIVTKIIISSFTSFWWRIICEKWRFSSLHTLQYIRTKIEKKMLQQISKVHVLQSSVKFVHYFWVYYSQWSSSAQWRIELFSNFGSILIDLKDKPRRKRFTLENFSTTQHQTSFFVVLARDSNFFLLFKVRILVL